MNADRNNTLEQFRLTEEQQARQSWEIYQRHKRNLAEELAEKAISGAALSQRDRWLIAELLTGKSYQEPKARGKQADPDADINLFMRFCRIIAELELSTPGLNPKKIDAKAYSLLADEESQSRDSYNEAGDMLDESTIRKAVHRGIKEMIRRKQISGFKI